MGALKDWAKENWVDIGAPKKDGKYQPCGRKNAKTSKRKYPKCVPAAKAAGMSKSQKASAVARKRAKAQGVGGKPTMVKTKGGGMAKKKFPDLSGDGKVTKKDILMGRGVVKADRGTFIARRLGLTGLRGKALSKTKDFLERRMELQGVKTTKGMTKAEINKLLEKIKRTKAQKFTARRAKLAGKATSDAAKVGVGVAVGLTAAEKDRQDRQKKLAANRKKKAVKKKTKQSKADIIGKGAPKGRAQGGMVTKGQGAAVRGTKFKGTF